MKRDGYDQVPASSTDDVSFETQGFLEETQVKTQSQLRSPYTKTIIAICLISVATLLNGLSLFIWTQPGSSSCEPLAGAADSLNYFRM